MTIAKKVEAMITRSSWIRKMFEEGARLKSIHGAGNVYDFSLGNPNLPPPVEFNSALKQAVEISATQGHGYMPNTGFPHVCQAIARYLSEQRKVQISGSDVIMTCGAAGAVNITLKAILDPGDEVIAPAPYFVEYGFYTDNHGGVFKTVPTCSDFTLDLDAIATAINPSTKAIILNFPNNPTGQIYSEESLKQLGKLLEEKCNTLNRIIYVISDEPYSRIVYDDARVPDILTCYHNSIIASSYSKDLSIAGERIGFAVVNPKATHRDALFSAMALANRILGFVNAPALMQRVIASVQGACVDVAEYKKKRDLLCDGLSELGYEFVKPQGAFYLFPRSPIADDFRFVQALQEELILTVPGSGFGGPGHFRIAYCVEDDTIINAMPGFKRAMERFK
ncbi:MAG: pyridoxal phosphate-dependent aminotransferase [Deltaproteobacteria bacterium]|nr:pyridoxal phosphate-dependent aminotransferase [Deltaproteobacteria bacterium]